MSEQQECINNSMPECKVSALDPVLNKALGSDVTDPLTSVTDIKQLSPECQKAIRRFKSWLKKHVGENYENVTASIVPDTFYDSGQKIVNYTLLLKDGKLIRPQILWSIKTKRAAIPARLDWMFNGFAATLDVTWQESNKALELMAAKNFYYLPKIKFVTSTKKKQVKNAGKQERDSG